jgi:dihydrofolate reductase
LPQLRGIQGIVLTSDQDYAVEPGWVTAGTPREAVTAAERAGSEGLLVAGGRTVNTAFLAERLVDEVVIDVESVIVARGVPLVAEADLEVALKLTGVRQLTETVVQLRYDVVR